MKRLTLVARWPRCGAGGRRWRVGVAGCKKKEAAPADAGRPQAPVNPARVTAVRVTEVQLGNALGEDKRVKAPTDRVRARRTPSSPRW